MRPGSTTTTAARSWRPGSRRRPGCASSRATPPLPELAWPRDSSIRATTTSAGTGRACSFRCHRSRGSSSSSSPIGWASSANVWPRIAPAIDVTDSAARLTTGLADRYHIERELGAGGMATVYLAGDLKHGRKVAIKVLRPELAAVIGAERFVREIRTVANLQHPHILGLIDSGEVGGTAYYVMPFVEGESLRDRLTREKQLPVDEAVRLTAEVAGAQRFSLDVRHH